VQRSLAEQRLVHCHRSGLRIVLRAGPSSEHDLGAVPLRADAQHRTAAGTPTRSTSHIPSLQPDPAGYERQYPYFRSLVPDGHDRSLGGRGTGSGRLAGRSPTARSSNGGARNGTRRRQGRQAPAHLRGAKCGAEIAGAGLGRGLCGPPPSSSSLLRGSARRASNGVTLVFYAPLTFRWFRVGRVSGGADSLRRASLASGVCDGLQLTLRPVERVLSRRAGTRRPASSGPSAGAALGREVQEECRASQASRSARLVLATQIDVSAAP
jgi:hypothetical protein